MKLRTFAVAQRISVRNHWGGKVKWLPGDVLAVKGPRRYLVRVSGRTRYVHADHMIRDHSTIPEEWAWKLTPSS